jgi:putative hydrolase of the HAD superfamily
VGRTEMALRGIFFDLDETLISYEAAEDAGFVASASLLGIEVGLLRDAVIDAYVRGYGVGTPGFSELATLPTRTLRERLSVAALQKLGLTGDVSALVDAHEAACARALFVFPETIEVLAALRERYTLGLITNGPGPMQREKLARFDLARFFSVIAVDTEVGYSKPDPRIFAWAAARAGLAPEELLFVGNDLEADIGGARAAGWGDCCIMRGHSRVEEAAERTIFSLGELLDAAKVAKMPIQ